MSTFAATRYVPRALNTPKCVCGRREGKEKEEKEGKGGERRGENTTKINFQITILVSNIEVGLDGTAVSLTAELSHKRRIDVGFANDPQLLSLLAKS